MRTTFEVFSENSIPLARAERNRIDEIKIGGLKLKSKYETILLLEKIIEDKRGDPQIVMDQVSFTSTIISIKWSSSNYADQYVQEHSDNQ